MKKVILVPLLFAAMSVLAQTQNTTTPQKKTRTERKQQKTFRSKKGNMTARTLGEQDMDTTKAFDKDAKHINSNYNESTPPLSPNSGSAAPKSR